MDELSWLSVSDKLVPKNYIAQGGQALSRHHSKIRELLNHRKIPKDGWDDATIELFLQELSAMDSNNFLDNTGVGEREGRIYSSMVQRRHFRLAHGIGRSGDITAVQPKAAGSSLVNKLANALALDAIKVSGIRSCAGCLVVPMATGMSLLLSLIYFRRRRPSSAKYVIWSRIDQKSCFKSIISAGVEPIIVEPLMVGDELQTNIPEITKVIESYGPEQIVCIMTTTSCFAPRAADKIEEVAVLCSQWDIPHLVNNAYGLQSSKCCHLIEQASKRGRVDVFVQSLDKNFMVPVGGAIIASFDDTIVTEIGKSYPGRASATPSLDLLITLLSMGSTGYTKLLAQRKEMYAYLKEKLSACVEKHGCRLLSTSGNPISLAVSLEPYDVIPGNDKQALAVTKLGSMLFTRCCSGARVVAKGEAKFIDLVEGYEFVGFGAHCRSYPCSYLNAAAAIGMERSEVDSFIERLDKCLTQLSKEFNLKEAHRTNIGSDDSVGCGT